MSCITTTRFQSRMLIINPNVQGDDGNMFLPGSVPAAARCTPSQGGETRAMPGTSNAATGTPGFARQQSPKQLSFLESSRVPGFWFRSQRFFHKQAPLPCRDSTVSPFPPRFNISAVEFYSGWCVYEPGSTVFPLYRHMK